MSVGGKSSASLGASNFGVLYWCAPGVPISAIATGGLAVVAAGFQMVPWGWGIASRFLVEPYGVIRSCIGELLSFIHFGSERLV